MTPKSRKLEARPSPPPKKSGPTLDDMFSEARKQAEESERVMKEAIEEPKLGGKVEEKAENEEKSEKIVFETTPEEPKTPEIEETGTKKSDSIVEKAPENTTSLKNNTEKVEKSVEEVTEKPPMDLEGELKTIISVQRGKRAVPTMITFFSARSNALRHVIVDVTDSVIDEAWEKYQDIKGYNSDEEEFMSLVYKILNVDIPRMYRAVATVTLKKR